MDIWIHFEPMLITTPYICQAHGVPLHVLLLIPMIKQVHSRFTYYKYNAMYVHNPFLCWKGAILFMCYVDN